MKARIGIGIGEKETASLGKILNTLLADEFVLYTKTRRFHWNVVGADFGELHKFFEEQYEALDDIVDEVAERARALDVTSAGSLKEFGELTRLKEQAGGNPDASGMLGALLDDLLQFSRVGRTQLKIADIDCDKLAREVWADLRGLPAWQKRALFPVR